MVLKTTLITDYMVHLLLPQALHTPNVNFEIHQLTLNPNGKFLAVAGARQIAVVVLPRTGFTKHAPATLECKYASLLVGIECWSNEEYVLGPYK